MIPRDFITEWRAQAPWVQDSQVEQDPVISRALVDIFSHPHLRAALAFRGGTALYKLYLKPAARYSEDIDLVQVTGEPIGGTLDALRGVLDPWLGDARYKRSEGRVTLTYRFQSNDQPPIPLKLKIEINSREHFSVQKLVRFPFAVRSRWFSGEAEVTTYQLNELLGTKLRALYQRRKGRDLFDLATALAHPDAAPAEIIAAFNAYMERGQHEVSRADFEQNLALKLKRRDFSADIASLLAPGHDWDRDEGARILGERLIALLPGGPRRRDA
jgi:predicted nucleotidyltransferase component of viral defense system